MTETPYITVKEAAGALDISQDGVRKLIRRGKLHAVKRSERNTLIPRPAFNAYLRKLHGETPQPLGMVVAAGELPERVAAFIARAGKAPGDWLSEWASDGTAELDDVDGMELAVSAFGLVLEQRAEAFSAPLPVNVMQVVSARHA